MFTERDGKCTQILRRFHQQNTDVYACARLLISDARFIPFHIIQYFFSERKVEPITDKETKDKHWQRNNHSCHFLISIKSFTETCS